MTDGRVLMLSLILIYVLYLIFLLNTGRPAYFIIILFAKRRASFLMFSR
jgi:hypothetical protein